MGFAPLSSILEHLQPGRDGDGLPLFRPVRPLIAHKHTFGVGHQAKMTAVRTGQTHNRVFRAVGVEGVFHGRLAVIVHVLHGNAVALDRLFLDGFIGPETSAFTVANPHTQGRVLHALKHDSVALFHTDIHKTRFELAGLVLNEARLLGLLDVLPRKNIQLSHQLTTIADTQREGVFAGIELIQSLFSLGVEEESASPTFSRAQYVRVREAG